MCQGDDELRREVQRRRAASRWTSAPPKGVTFNAGTAPAVSPDGRWVAYGWAESGIPELYVRPFSPHAGGVVLNRQAGLER